MKKLLTLFVAFLVLAVLAVAQPEITSGAGSYSVPEGQQLTVNFVISAAQGTTTIAKTAAFGTLAPSSGSPLTASVFTWTPAFDQSGVYKINFTVSNGTSSDSKTVTVTVVDVPTMSMLSTKLTLGDRNQRRSNPLHNTPAERQLNLTGTITITNTGARTLTGFTASISPAAGFSLEDIRSNITFSSISVVSGASITANVIMRIPEELDSVDSADSESPLKVATITFTANDGAGTSISVSSDVDMQAKNMLDIDNGDYSINGGDTHSLDEDTSIDELKPDDEITITLDAKSLFRSAEDVEIRDITARLEINDLDVDEEEDFSDLSPGDTDTVTLSFTLDSDVDEGTYDSTLIVEGTDENGARHAVKWQPEFVVERKNHEITISSFAFSPSAITCESSVSLRVTMKNTGTRDEDEVSLHLESAELKFGDVINDMVLDEGDTVTKTFVIPIPANLPSGNARVIIKTYYSTDTESDSETAIIQKSACVTTPEEQPTTTTQPPVIVITQPPVNQTTPTGNVIAQPVVEEKSFMQTSGYTALLILGYIVVIVAGIYLIGKVLRK
ncbi:MAG: hypothetical protein V1702_05615 [Candidatus Woesearchaeota archaeon]